MIDRGAALTNMPEKIVVTDIGRTRLLLALDVGPSAGACMMRRNSFSPATMVRRSVSVLK
jgi:hypothetical protein